MHVRKLGKKPAVHDPRTPRMTAMLGARLPAPPVACDWGRPVASYPLWRNGDQLSNHGQTIPGLGDCTAVSVASAILTWTANRGGAITLTDDEVVGIYERQGYDPNNPATDQGAVEIEVLNRWCDEGYAIGRQAPDVLTGYGFIDPKHADSVRRAIAMLGGLYVGLSLPDYALRSGWAWTAPNGPYQIAGGHAVFIHGYDDEWLYLNSWGQKQQMDWGFFTTFCDEAYGLLSRDWIDTGGASPMRESFAGLADELRAARTA